MYFNVSMKFEILIKLWNFWNFLKKLFSLKIEIFDEKLQHFVKSFLKKIWNRNVCGLSPFKSDLGGSRGLDEEEKKNEKK